MMTFLFAFLPVTVIILIYAIVATYTKWLDGVDARRKQFMRFIVGDRMYFYGQHKIRLNFLKTIFEYVFGKERAEKEERLVSKNILAYLTFHDYRITTAEISALTGLSLSKAENEAAKLLYQYHGDVKVTNKGVIVYEFPKLESQIHQDEERESKFIWETPLEINNWNDNFVFENGLISLVGFFILVASGVLLFTGEELEFDFVPHIFMTHWLPFIFTLLFFGISLFGKLKYLVQAKKDKKQNSIHLFWSNIFQSPKALSCDFENSIEKQAIYQLEGAFSADEFGNEVCVFERLAEEIEEVEKSRYRQIDFKKENNLSSQSSGEVYINEHVKYEKNDDKKELIFYFKRKGEPISYLSLSLFGGILFLSLVFLVSLLFEDFSSWISIIFVLGFTGLIFRKFIRELSFSTNSHKLHFTPNGLNVINGPIPLMGINRKVSPGNFKSISYDTHMGTYKKLYLNLRDEKFSKPLLENETNHLCFREIQAIVNSYVGENWYESEY
jgi:hypothetical protein